MAPIAAPPGLSLPEGMQAPPGLSLPQESRAVAPPPGFAPIEHSKKVSPPPGLTKIPEDGQAAVEEVQPKSIFSIADHLGITDDDPLPCKVVPVAPVEPVAPAPVHGVRGYRELQKAMFEKEKLEKKVKRIEALERLEAMVNCVEELDAIKKKVDSIGDRTVKKTAEPSPWSKKESKSHPGKFYWVNSKTGKTSWTKPEDYVEPQEVSRVVAKPAEKAPVGLSDYEGSTDACSSESDYDSDYFARSVSSRTSSQSPVSVSVLKANAPVFKPGFRADAPEFKPSALAA